MYFNVFLLLYTALHGICKAIPICQSAVDLACSIQAQTDTKHHKSGSVSRPTLEDVVLMGVSERVLTLKLFNFECCLVLLAFEDILSWIGLCNNIRT